MRNTLYNELYKGHPVFLTLQDLYTLLSRFTEFKVFIVIALVIELL